MVQPAGGFLLLGRDPHALPRGCSRAVDELIGSGAFPASGEAGRRRQVSGKIVLG